MIRCKLLMFCTTLAGLLSGWGGRSMEASLITSVRQYPFTSVGGEASNFNFGADPGEVYGIQQIHMDIGVNQLFQPFTLFVGTNDSYRVTPSSGPGGVIVDGGLVHEYNVTLWNNTSSFLSGLDLSLPAFPTYDVYEAYSGFAVFPSMDSTPYSALIKPVSLPFDLPFGAPSANAPFNQLSLSNLDIAPGESKDLSFYVWHASDFSGGGGYQLTLNANHVSVPEPGSMALAGIGASLLGGAGFFRKKRRTETETEIETGDLTA